MQIRFISLSMIMAAVFVFRAGFAGISGTAMQSGIEELFTDTDAESLLACGQPVSYTRADMYQLELIPGISDTLAERLLSNRPEVQQEICSSAARPHSQALERIHGIGPVTATRLGRYLQLKPENGCTHLR